MKKLDLGKLNVIALKDQEMNEITGGALFRANGIVGWVYGKTKWKDVEFEILGFQIK